MPSLALTAFVTSKTAAGLSPATIAWYRAFISAWLVEHPALDATPAELESYLAALRGRGLSPATVAGHYRALSVWFIWLVQRGLLPASPLAAVRRPKQPTKRVAYVTPQELELLLGSISETAWSDMRDRALLLLLFYSGLRVGEATALHVGEVDFARRVLLVRRAKGGSARLAPYAAEVAPALLDYLYCRPPWDGPELWLSNDGYGGVRGKLTAEGVRQMLRRRCRLTGMRYINPHAFRHGYAMWTLNAGMELSAVSAAMGHSSTQITQATYARWLPDGLLRQYDAAAGRLRSQTHTR